MKKYGWTWVLLAIALVLVSVVTAMITLRYSGQDAAANIGIVSDQTYSFTFPASGKDGSAVTEKVYYSDEFFSSDSGAYNPQLAKASLALAAAGFKADYAEEFLLDLGFSELEFYRYDKKADEDKSAAVFAVKKLGNQTVLAVCLRGGKYGDEWGSNGRLGIDGTADGYHYGFHTAAKDVEQQLEAYAEEQDINLKSCRLWLVGFSRGGAVAGCLAADLKDNGIENLYCYTFASPATVSAALQPHTYSGIYNLVNPLDLVTRLPMNSSGETTIASSGRTIFYHWDYVRYGTIIQLSADSSDSMKLKAVDLLERALAFATRNEENYVKKQQDSTVIPLLKETMGSGEEADRKIIVKLIVEALPGTKKFLINEWEQLDWKSQLYLAELLSGSKQLHLTKEHYPETYWELMEQQ